MADAASGTNQPPIIIKKKRKGGGHGHHGGAWKVAYADFVTAMMAFFLLLWLLNATTEEQRIGIANYFAPSVAPDSSSGSNGVMGGQTVTTDGFLCRDITWDGRDDFGDRIGKGVYIYKLTVRSTATGKQSEKYEKLVIL